MKSKNHIYLYGGILALFILVSFILLYSNQANRKLSSTQSKASSVFSLEQSALSENSTFVDNAATTVFSLTTQDNQAALYNLSENTTNEVLQFIADDPLYTSSSLIPDSPENFNLSERVQNDQNGAHYYFSQTRCDGIPVFGAHLNIHLGKDSNVYALSGGLVKNDADCTTSLTQADAEAIATQTYSNEEQTENDITIIESLQYIVNPQLFGYEDDQNYVTQSVEVCSGFYCKQYFVDLKSGNIILSFTTTADALQRRVTAGSIIRNEGDAAVSDQRVNKVYDLFEVVHNYYLNTHQRDSYDGRGGLINGNIECTHGREAVQASWLGGTMYICEDSGGSTSYIANDVVAHEFTHGVTGSTAGLVYQFESGALNESISDVFGYLVDNNDWTMGEETKDARINHQGVIRDMSNPPAFRHPDDAFSTFYKCVDIADDYGGVHTNSGVFNKAFYLMVDGGTHGNNLGQCTITGIGKDKAGATVYKALTTYMVGNTAGNYRSMYDAMLQACSDLYQADSADCQSVKAAMQAVSMDQQEVGKQKGPKCWGQTQGAPTCTGSGPTGGVTGSPTQPAVETPTPTQPVSQKKTANLKSVVSSTPDIGGQVEIDFNGTIYELTAELHQVFFGIKQTLQNDDIISLKGQLLGKDIIDTGTFREENGAFTNTFSAGKDLTSYHVYQVMATDTSSKEFPILIADLEPQASLAGTIELDIKLRFQGITKKPDAIDAMPVRIGISGCKLTETVITRAYFTPDDQGIWSGTAVFNSSDISPDDCYNVKVKGNKHEQGKYCQNKPTEDESGFYKGCSKNSVSLNIGSNDLDFSGVVQLAGDLNQDGVINAFDILSVRQHLNSTKFEDLAVADVNGDGVINGNDDGLIIQTLSSGTDEQ